MKGFRYDVVGFDEAVIARIKLSEKRLIKLIVRKNRDLFESPSHFIRAAIIRQISRYDKKGGLLE